MTGWGDNLYAGSAAYYARGRMPYPPGIAPALRDELGLDGTGRLLDVGCGPGSLTRLLAPLFAETVGVDADAGMVAVATAAVPGATFRVLRAEALPADLGTFRVVTFAQSFHWMDQPRVAAAVRGMLDPAGAWVHVGATTHRGESGDGPLWDRIDALVVDYLGPVRRAGRATLPTGTAGGEEDVMRAAGYRGPVRVDVGGGETVVRTPDDVVAAVFSLSSSTPHLLGARVADFERDLRRLLPAEGVTIRRREVSLVIWRP